ncbi:MAG: hypothetical protein ACKO5F_04220 [Synechococcus sp.]
MAIEKVKLAARCPVAAYGWLYLQAPEAQLLARGPQQAHPDPKVSGQNPAYTTWGREQLQRICPGSEFYQQQIEQRRVELERERRMAAAAVNSAVADLDRLEVALADLDDLLEVQ